MTTLLGAEERHSILKVRVECARREAQDITSYELVSVDGLPLPGWTPGSHIDVHLPSGLVRQYSLCSDPENLSNYRIGVLYQTKGRGGSIEVHKELRPGVQFEISTPRTAFSLTEAEEYIFLAGGIGITPLMTMIRQLHNEQKQWKLIYAARTTDHFAFANELRALDASRVVFLDEETQGRPDLAQIAQERTAQIYLCGPPPMLDAMAAQMESAGRSEEFHFERFTPAPMKANERDSDLTVILAKSGKTVLVGPAISILDAVRAAGVSAPSSCEMGICGSCETKVFAGTPDHRDEILTEAEKAKNNVMMICVSRCAGQQLTLDL